MLKSMKNGAERMRDIVMSLQNFSPMDEESMKPTDIHESIDGVLGILHNIIKKGIEVVKEYGKLSNVTCYPALLSQVFMNTINYCL
ncbi:MAG: HAMP domain-containing histidine kinase [Hormoscilla sp. GM102CHS1]|nr:HAMP domain-containing histidine kinase [Hormoscilla sp. GM102CHS1]